MSKPRIVFVEQFYYPDGWAGTLIPRDLTVYLARNGYDVEVICGADQYAPVEGKLGEDPAASGVQIRRVGRLLSGDIHRRKLIRQLWFYAGALPRLAFRRRPELFITQTNPPLVVLIAAVVARLHSRPLMIIAMDLYPEVLFASGLLQESSFAGRLLRWIFCRAYRGATTVVALGETMARRIEEKGVPRARITTISNWSVGEEEAVRDSSNLLRREWGLEGCFVVLYSGNLGIAHDVKTPILALREVSRELPWLRLVFVGKGSRLAEAESLARDAGVLNRIQFRSLVPLELLPHSLGLADIALVTMLPGFEGLVVPSKVLGYLARGIPTIYIGPPSDVLTLLEDSGGGAGVNNGDVSRLASTWQRLAVDPSSLEGMRRSGAEYYAQHLSMNVGLSRYGEAIGAISRRMPAM